VVHCYWTASNDGLAVCWYWTARSDGLSDINDLSLLDCTVAMVEPFIATSRTTTPITAGHDSIQAHISLEIQSKSHSGTHFIKHHTNV
jgi:hypothetical protein